MTRSRAFLPPLALALVIALAASLTGAAVKAARAQDVDEATEATWQWESDGGDLERWWGMVGASLCGAEIRLIRVAPAIGMNPYVMAAGLSGCILAVIDVMTTQ